LMMTHSQANQARRLILSYRIFRPLTIAPLL
jgi:hypothetical protein